MKAHKFEQCNKGSDWEGICKVCARAEGDPIHQVKRTPEEAKKAQREAAEWLKRQPRMIMPVEDEQAGTPEGAKADTATFQQARRELGPDATLSAIAKRAQELKTAGKPAKDRRAGLHRALDCVLNRKAAKDTDERTADIWSSYSHKERGWALQSLGLPEAYKTKLFRELPASVQQAFQKLWAPGQKRPTKDWDPEYKDCRRCGRKTDVLEIFPGGVCLGCWEKKEGKAPLTEADFKGMVNTFKNPLKKRAKDTNAEALKKGDTFNYMGTPYIVVSNEGKYMNNQGGTFVDLRVKEIDSITGKGRGERLLSLRA